MPNWCNNNLTVRGTYKQVSKFVEDVRDDEDGFRLAQLVPCPQELKDTTSGWYSDEVKQKALEEQQKRNIEKYGYADWYDWEYENWGTKWGDCETDFISDEVIKSKNDQYSNCSFWCTCWCYRICWSICWSVCRGYRISVGVLVGVLVGVSVGVSVGALVGVLVGVTVLVGVLVGVFVGVLVGVTVLVGVFVGVRVGVSVGALS